MGTLWVNVAVFFRLGFLGKVFTRKKVCEEANTPAPPPPSANNSFADSTPSMKAPHIGLFDGTNRVGDVGSGNVTTPKSMQHLAVGGGGGGKKAFRSYSLSPGLSVVGENDDDLAVPPATPGAASILEFGSSLGKGDARPRGRNRGESIWSAISTDWDTGILAWAQSFTTMRHPGDEEEGGAAHSPYGEEQPFSFLSPYIGGYTTPGPMEREASQQHAGKANLGVMLGVYLPTIQHILGVTMFIRLAWCVGVAGIGQTFFMLFLCCLCTFLTCISVSAVATNGVVESGGAYFMISRNLGPEFGSAVGILFYLANTVATAMYLVGGVEILLLYIFPSLTIGGHEAHTDTGPLGMMSHNLRLYATILIVIEFLIVAMGVRFVQLLAPVSLFCVVLSILACYAGGIEKTLSSASAPKVCMFGEHLLQARAVLPDGASISELCHYCHPNNTELVRYLNHSFPAYPNPLDFIDEEDRTLEKIYEDLHTHSTAYVFNHLRGLHCQSGYPGYSANTLVSNLDSSYPQRGEYKKHYPANERIEVFQDVDTTFFLLLAIYFPAVTGILTGTNMSGDLANPQKSIPGGTIAAQLTTSFVYFSLALVFGATIMPELLRDKYGQSLDGGMVVAGLAWPSEWVLLIGSFLSTFGAALQCLCSAPRLLQSIAKDDVIPLLAPFAKVTRKNEPFLGLVVTAFIAELAVLLGAMDSIAAVVDFFFLMCYAFVNMICALHSLLGAPNWRPRYVYYHWSLSLLGAALCFFIMFSTHWDYALISLALCLLIYKYVEWKGAKKEWGDGIRGLALTTAQYSLMKIPETDPHPKNWRPQLLILHSMPWSKELVDVRYLNLINFASQLKAGKGLTMVVSFLRGDFSVEEDIAHAQQVKARMEADMQHARLRGFAKTLLYNEDQITGSLNALIQSIGIGGLRPNTILLSWPTRDFSDAAGDGRSTRSSNGPVSALDSEYQTFTDKLLAGAVNGMALVVAKGITDFPSQVKLHGYLDVYWIVRDGGLCVLITFLLKQNKVWRHCKIRIVAVAHHHENNEKIKQQLQNYIYQLRIDAEILVTELSDPELSKNAFERTLLMEERTRMLKQLQRGNTLPAGNFGEDAATRQPTKRFLVHRSRSDADMLKNGDVAKVGGGDGEGVEATTTTTEEQLQPMSGGEESTVSGERNDSSPGSQNGEEGLRKSSKGHKQSKVQIVTDRPESEDEDEGQKADDKADGNKSAVSKAKRLKALDRTKVHKMHGAIRLNELILEHSSDSQLVLFSLPQPPMVKEGVDDYIHYLEVISDKLKRVLFVRGTGAEVITTSS